MHHPPAIGGRALGEEGFLLAIRTGSNDDTNRLVYADWLEVQRDESSDAGAEYIRLDSGPKQVELSVERRRRLAECDACGQQVCFCKTLREAKDHAMLRHGVALDVRRVRAPGDIDPPEGIRMGGLGIL